MSQGRILVVDDLPDWRATLSGILLDEGYEVRVAGDCGEALRLLEIERFHIAILDVRLDEADEDNLDGLLLMHEIKKRDPTIVIIILTGYYVSVKIVQETLQPNRGGVSPAFIILDKSETDQLPEHVKHAFERVVRVNTILKIQDAEQLLPLLPRILRFTRQPKPPDSQLGSEVEELLRKLFFTCEEITLRLLKQGFSGAAVFRVEPRYHRRGRGECVVAKIGEWPLIEREERNFAQAVQGVVGGHRLPQRLDLARTRSLGGLVYSFAGLGEATGFVEFYTRAAPSDIVSVLENLFLETCFPWGRRDKVLQPSFNFTEHYFSHLHLDSAKLQRSLAALFDKQHCLSPLVDTGAGLRFLEDISLINPVEFILDRPLIEDAYLTLVHGDLTGYNVILDHHQETWLIDFAGTGQGLLLQDFASLENFVKLSLLESGDPRSFFEWERELANSLTLQPSTRLLDLAPPDEYSKAHQVILAIRRLAYQVSGDDHPKEYLIGLLFHALKLITIMSLKPIQRDLAMVSAALICQRLMADSAD